MVAQREHRLPTAFFFRKGEEARETPGPGESSFKGEHWHVRDVGRSRIRSYLQRITNLFACHATAARILRHHISPFLLPDSSPGAARGHALSPLQLHSRPIRLAARECLRQSVVEQPALCA